MQWPIMAIKNLTSLFPLIFLSKHINLYALGRLKWTLDIVWPLNQHFNMKNQRNWRTTFFMLRFLIGIICILLHRLKKLTLRGHCPNIYFACIQTTRKSDEQISIVYATAKYESAGITQKLLTFSFNSFVLHMHT